MLAKPSSSQFSKDTKIGHFLKFFKGGTKGKSLKKWGDFGGLQNNPAQIRRSPNCYALKVQSSENILTQTAPQKVLAKPSSSKFSKDTKIGHFLKFFKGGTKGKSLKKWADFGGLKNTPAQIRRSLNCYALKVQSSENILTQTAPQKVLAKPSSSKFSKDTKIGRFLKFFKGGTKGKSLKKWADFGGLKNTPAQIRWSLNCFALKVQSSENILTQTAPQKVLAKPSSSKFSKDTKIGHFLKFFKGGTKGKSLKKWADFGGLKNTPAQIRRSLNCYALKVQSSENILTQTAPQKVLAKPSSSKFSKDTKIGRFLKFFKGGTKGKSLKKWADFGGLKNTPAQIQRSLNCYALKVQSSENILTQTAPQKVLAKPSSSKFSKDTKIGRFLKFFKGGTKGKSLKKWADFGGLKNTPAQIRRSLNCYALKVQSSENILTQTAPQKVLAKPSSSKFSKDTKIGRFLKFFKGGTKGKSLKKWADFGGLKNNSGANSAMS